VPEKLKKSSLHEEEKFKKIKVCHSEKVIIFH